MSEKKIYSKYLQKEYEKHLKEIHAKVNQPFKIQISCPHSSGCQHVWYLPSQISWLETRYPDKPQKKSEVLIGGYSDKEDFFVANESGTFCILGETRQQWRIAKEARLPDRYIIHVKD